MTLHRPSEPSWYINDSDRHILQKMDETYSYSITINQSFWSEADIDSRFRAGDQTLWQDIYGNLPAFRKRQFNFNRIRRICNLVTGYQRRNRNSTVYTPRENADAATAAQFTKLSYWFFDQANIGEMISGAFDGMLTTGMNLLSFWADYRTDPISGDPKVDNLNYNSFLIDPYFRKHDLSDCNFIWTRKYLSKIEALSLYPERKKDIEGINVRQSRDGKFQFLPESYNYGMQDLLFYDEYWYRDYREQELLVDTTTGETMEWTGNEETLQEYLKYYGKRITKVTQTVPTVKLATVLEGHVLYHGANPLGIDRYPFVPVLGYYDPQLPYFPWRIQGMVRGLRDAQFLYNRRKVIELDILESQINSGWKVKEDALVNPKDAFLNGQGRLLTLKQDALMTDVEQIHPPNVPPSMIQLSQILGQELQEISGVNEELLGSATDDKAGILSMLRQGAGLTTLQILFDQLDQAQKYLGQIYMEYVQKNFTPGKIERIIQEKPSPEFYHRCFGKYDAVVEEGVNTSTQRQTQFLQLLHLREIGIPIPPAILLENATLTDKDELVKAIQAQEKQESETQQQQTQVQLELLKAQIEDLQARAAANIGLGNERLSRIEENRSLATQREAEAVENISRAKLDKVKAMKELQGMDIQQLQSLFDLINQIQLGNEEEQVKAVDDSKVPSPAQNIPEQPKEQATSI